MSQLTPTPPLLETSETCAPVRSAGHSALVALAEEKGDVDIKDLRSSLRLFNAHPQLVGQKSCFSEALHMLEDPELADSLSPSFGELVEHIPALFEVAKWGAKQKDPGIDGLSQFFRQPRTEHHNLMMRHGIGRHALVGALLVSHHADPGPTAPRRTIPLASQIFRLLKWHFFCIHADARADCSVEAYENYAGQHEWPANPCASDGIGRALRDLSDNPAFDALLVELPYELDAALFAKTLLDRKTELQELARAIGSLPRLDALLHYFNAFHDWQDQRGPRRRGKGRGAGTRQPIPGFIQFESLPDVVLHTPDVDQGDLDVATQTFTTVYTTGFQDLPSLQQAEAEGLAPQEDFVPLLDLFFPNFPGAFLGILNQTLHLEAAAQKTHWHKSNLTALEVKVLVDFLDESQGTSVDPDVARIAADARLLLRAMLLLGCPIEDAGAIQYMSQAELEQRPLDGRPISTRYVVYGPSGKCIGIAVPAIRPRYRTDPPADQASVANTSAPYLLLPDATGIGADLLAHCGTCQPPSGSPAFRSRPDEVDRAARDLLLEANRRLERSVNPRITLRKINNKLGSALKEAGLDDTAVALICGDQRYIAQSRLHYTQHLVEDLQKFYAKTARRLLKRAGQPLQPMVAAPATAPAPAIHVGARSVVAADHLHRFVADAREFLCTHPGDSVSARHGYHERYLLHSLLLQNITTAARGTLNPGSFMDAFLKARPEASHRRTGRSASLLMVSHADKDDQYRSNARVVFVNTRLEAQLRHLNRHTQAIESWRPAYVQLPKTDRANGAFVSWDHGKARASERSKFPIHAFVVSPQWIEQQLSRHGLPAPANFHRLFVRTALAQRKCPQQAIDAFMGHALLGELPHIRHGSFDYSEFHKLIADHIDAICDEIGLVALPSALTRAYDQA